MAILNAAMEYGGVVHSIDVTEKMYRKPFLPVGHCVKEQLGDEVDKVWTLHIGEPAEVLRKLDLDFVFCVIDTLHAHPVETLYFISALPYLNNGAITIMHDTTVYAWMDNKHVDCFMKMFAPRLLLTSVCAEKLIPNLPSGNMNVSNIAAWQISEDTRKYCDNLFDVLYMPWEMDIADATIKAVEEIVAEKYKEDMLNKYHEAIRLNREMFVEAKCRKMGINKSHRDIPNNTVFYGAGSRMKELLSLFDEVNFDFEYKIWDKNFDKISTVGGKRVLAPNYEMRAEPGQLMVVMIEDKNIFNEIKTQFEKLNYTVYHGLNNQGFK